MTKFEMNYRKTDMRAFFNDIIKKNMIKGHILMYTIIGLTIFAVFIIASYFFNDGFDMSVLPFIFLAVYIIIVFIAIQRKIRNAPDKMFKDFNLSYDGETVTTTFLSDRVYVESSNNANDKNGYVLYSDLKGAVESDNYFYIFINDSAAQIIKKSSVVEGSIENVRKYLKSALGSEYKNITIQRRN